MTSPDLREHLQTTLGSAYEFERELGGGGMSRVFLATERGLGRRVVVKVLPPDMSAAVSAERFRRKVHPLRSDPRFVRLMKQLGIE